MRINSGTENINMATSSTIGLEAVNMEPMSAGEELTGKVLFISENRVNIALDNGMLLRARLEHPIPLNEGDTVRLVVSDVNASRIMMEIAGVSGGDQGSHAPLAVRLQNMGLEATPQNIDILNALSNLGLQGSREVVGAVRAALQKFPGLEPQIAVFAAANDIPITTDTVKILQNIFSNNASLAGEQLKEIWHIISKGGENTPAAPLQAEGGAPVLPAQAAPDAPAIQTQQQPGAPIQNDAAIQAQQQPGSPIQNDAAIQAQQQPGAPVQNDAATQVQQQPVTPTQAEADAPMRDGIPAQQLRADAPAQSGTATAPGADTVQTPHSVSPEWQTRQIAEPLTDSSRAQAAFALELLDGGEVDLSRLSRATDGRDEAAHIRLVKDGGELLRDVARNETPPAERREIFTQYAERSLEKLPAQQREAVVSALERAYSELGAKDDAGYKAAVKLNNVMEKLFADAERPEQRSVQIKRAGEQLSERLELLKTALEQAPAGVRMAAMGQAERLITQTRILDSINQFTYVQIPIQLGNQQQTAELYVFKRDGGRRVIDPENASMLVAIDSEFMGRVESLVAVKGKTVSVQFKLDTEDVAAHMQNYTVDLNELLAEMGYRLADAKFSSAEQPVNPLSALAVFEEDVRRFERKVNVMI